MDGQIRRGKETNYFPPFSFYLNGIEFKSGFALYIKILHISYGNGVITVLWLMAIGRDDINTSALACSADVCVGLPIKRHVHDEIGIYGSVA